MVSIYAFNIKDIDDDDYKKFQSQVSLQRQNRAKHFRHFKDSVRCVCSELILKYAYQRNLSPIKVGTNFYGKPYIMSDPHFNFNLSHSGDFVVCAVASTDVGVDIEKFSKIDVDALSEQLFTPDEQCILQSYTYLEKQAFFFKIWTAKESYVKCRGMGLNIALNSFDVTEDYIYTSEKKFTPYKLFRFVMDETYQLTACSIDSLVDYNIKYIDHHSIIELIS